MFFNYRIDLDENGTVNGTDGSDILYGLDGDDMLFGGDGADTLFGGAGADTFVFQDGAVSTAEDRIEDFSVGDNDVLDISDILSGFDAGADDIADFARFVDTGADAFLEVDVDGAANGQNFESIALIIGGAGLDAATLYGSGNIDAVI